MPHYVLLMRYHSDGLKAAHDDPRALTAMHEALERWEAKVLASYTTMGIWDHCLIIDAPNNFKAYRPISRFNALFNKVLIKRKT